MPVLERQTAGTPRARARRR